MSTITFGVATLYARANGYLGWSFEPGALRRQTITNPAPVGIGYWLKPGNVDVANHRLSIQYENANPGNIRAQLQSLQGLPLATLTVPAHGVYPNCEMSIRSFKTTAGDGGFAIEVELEFTQYP